jgi:hypothetical protein
VPPAAENLLQVRGLFEGTKKKNHSCHLRHQVVIVGDDEIRRGRPATAASTCSDNDEERIGTVEACLTLTESPVKKMRMATCIATLATPKREVGKKKKKRVGHVLTMEQQRSSGPRPL